MTVFDFFDIGEHIAKKTKKETIFKNTNLEILNEDFKYIKFIFGFCVIKHKKDLKKGTIQYKTLNGAKRYVNQFYEVT